MLDEAGCVCAPDRSRHKGDGGFYREAGVWRASWETMIVGPSFFVGGTLSRCSCGAFERSMLVPGWIPFLVSGDNHVDNSSCIYPSA